MRLLLRDGLASEMTTKTTYQHPNEFGYYGKFGGAYIPEMLHRNVEELKSRYLEIMNETSFQKSSRNC